MERNIVWGYEYRLYLTETGLIKGVGSKLKELNCIAHGLTLYPAAGLWQGKEDEFLVERTAVLEYIVGKEVVGEFEKGLSAFAQALLEHGEEEVLVTRRDVYGRKYRAGPGSRSASATTRSPAHPSQPYSGIRAQLEAIGEREGGAHSE